MKFFAAFIAFAMLGLANALQMTQNNSSMMESRNSTSVSQGDSRDQVRRRQDTASLMESSPTSTSESSQGDRRDQVGRRQVLINTKNTIQQYFFGHCDRGEWADLLAKYNAFNIPTRSAASSLASQYNQQGRKNTLFSAMTALANAATIQDKPLCTFKSQATVDAIVDFLANVGS